MLSNLYKSHVAENISLVQSMVLKSDSVIASSQRYLAALGIPDSDDPRTWKYYLNLSGQYHNSDTKMVIISADTKADIIFDKDVLIDHPLTVAEYKRGRILRADLERKYPKQVELIERILNPIDIDVAIAAKDFEILYYDKTLLAINETNVIPKIQGWINRFTARWFNVDYTVVDALYTSDFIAKLLLLMVTEIANIRLDNCRTKYVGQWHIWAYLSGYYDLAEYRQYITTEQSLYLYRNIKHIRMNMGSNAILKDLVEHMLHPMSLQAYRFDMYKLENKYLEERTFRPRFNKALLYDENIEVDEISMVESRGMLELTKEQGSLNVANLDKHTEKLYTGVNNSIDNTRATSVIEVSQVEAPVGNFANMTQLRMTYWMYLAASGLYSSAIHIQIPGKASANLSPLDTLIMLMYSLQRAKGVAAADIVSINPAYYNANSEHNNNGTWPNVAVNNGYVEYPADVGEFIQYGKIPFIQVNHVIPATYRPSTDLVGLLDNEHVHIDSAITSIYSNLVQLREVHSVSELGDFCTEVADQQFKFIRSTQYAKTALGASLIDTAALSILENRFMHVSSFGKTWDDWLADIEFDESNLEAADWESIAFSCLHGAAGIDTTYSTIPDAQLAMIEVVDLLTSYGLIVLEGNALADTDRLDWFETTVDKLGDRKLSKYHVTGGELNLNRQGDVLISTVDGVDIEPITYDEIIGVDLYSDHAIENSVDITSTGIQQSYSVIGLADIEVKNVTITHTDDDGQVII